MGTIEKIFASLGTVNHLAAEFDESRREAIRLAFDRAEEYITDMDDRLSVFKPESEISQINANAGIRDTLVGRDTFDLLSLCVRYGELTDGVFDITTKPLTNAGKLNARVDYRDVLLNNKSLSVRLRNCGQGIHLGGIAKGYAVDRVAEILERQGVSNASVNLGGTVRNIGQSRSVGIRNPFEPNSIAASLDSVDETVVTSGLYERGSHIFDPKSGKPAENELASVTVVGKNGAAADAAATACMVLGTEGSVRLLNSLGLDGILILRSGGIFATESIRERVKTA